MWKKIIAVTGLAWTLPLIALAEDSYAINVSFLPESVENALEIIILVLAVIAAVYAVKLAALSQGGALEKTWNWLAIVALVFAVLEIYGTLNGYGILRIGGLGDVIELVMAVVLVIVFYRTRKDLLKKLLGKN